VEHREHHLRRIIRQQIEQLRTDIAGLHLHVETAQRLSDTPTGAHRHLVFG